MLITPSDRFAIFGARGMAGSAISRALDRVGYQQQLKPSRAELDLLDPLAVQHWFAVQPTVVVLQPRRWAASRPTTLRPFSAETQIQTRDRNGLAIRGAASVFLGSSCIPQVR